MHSVQEVTPYLIVHSNVGVIVAQPDGQKAKHGVASFAPDTFRKTQNLAAWTWGPGLGLEARGPSPSLGSGAWGATSFQKWPL